MKKTEAIELLGGTVAATAAAIGISYEAVYKWPDTLTSRIEDRVHAALARKQALPRCRQGCKASQKMSPVSK